MVRLTAIVWGLWGVGKSYSALTWPRPIRFHNIDLNADHLVETDAKGKSRFLVPALRALGGDVHEYRYAPPRINMPGDEAERALEKFFANFESDVAELDAGTLVIDTGTSLRQLMNKTMMHQVEEKRGWLRDEKTGLPKIDSTTKKPMPNPKFEVYPFDYATPNEWFKNTINVAKAKPQLNVVMTGMAKEIWDSRGRPTGAYELQLPDMAPYLVQLVLRIIVQDGFHMAYVEKDSFNSEREGKTTVPVAKGGGLLDEGITWDEVQRMVLEDLKKTEAG